MWAAEYYGLTLFDPSHPTHDAYDRDGRLVQIRTTQHNRVALSGKPNFLIVLKIDEEGNFEEVYNGLGKPTWRNGDDRRQYKVSLSRLKKLNEQVGLEDKITPVE